MSPTDKFNTAFILCVAGQYFGFKITGHIWRKTFKNKKGKMKNTIKYMFVLLASLFMMSFAPAAKAALPNWCYDYTAYDSFDTPNTWSPWNNSTAGTITIGPSTIMFDGYNTAQMSFAWLEFNNNFLILDKVFNLANDVTYRWAKAGYGTTPYHPPHNSGVCGGLKFCDASIYIYTKNGASGGIQLIDPDTYTILGNQSFNLPGSNNWNLISISGALQCKDIVLFRVGITKTPSSFSMIVDGVAVDWYY